MTPALLEFMGIRRRTAPPFPWWEIEDEGGFPPWWQYGLRGRIFNDRIPWPSEWDRRPHP